MPGSSGSEILCCVSAWCSFPTCNGSCSPQSPMGAGARIARWALALQAYNFTVEHKLGRCGLDDII